MKKLLNQARMLYGANRYSEALPIANRVLSLEKNNEEALFFVAHSLYHAGQFRRSLQYWRRLQKITPDEPYLNLNMGACYDDLGNSTLAIKHFKRELVLNPFCGRALYNLGSLYYRARKCRLAIPYLQRCFEWKHSADAVVSKLAWCYFKTGQLEREQALYEHWLQLHPNDTWALNNLGSHLMGQGAYYRALLRLKKASGLDPSDTLVARNIRKVERMIKKLKQESISG